MKPNASRRGRVPAFVCTHPGSGVPACEMLSNHGTAAMNGNWCMLWKTFSKATASQVGHLRNGKASASRKSLFAVMFVLQYI